MWKVPRHSRIGSPWVAHYTSGPGAVDGLERVLCDPWLNIPLGVRATPANPRCEECAALATEPGSDPRQQSIFDALEAMT